MIAYRENNTNLLFFEVVPELDSKLGPLDYKALALTTLLYCFSCHVFNAYTFFGHVFMTQKFSHQILSTQIQLFSHLFNHLRLVKY